jgi:hypothetical protein
MVVGTGVGAGMVVGVTTGAGVLEAPEEPPEAVVGDHEPLPIEVVGVDAPWPVAFPGTEPGADGEELGVWSSCACRWAIWACASAIC